ncbi:HEAT repeat-containing protein 4 [Thoreauomyces humboldtii]|nr:HEAT repeat-containing protein 4 [Thoreauomyces humboldtii]
MREPPSFNRKSASDHVLATLQSDGSALDGIRGYRGMTVHDPRVEPLPGQQYGRPHRKALLSTLRVGKSSASAFDKESNRRTRNLSSRHHENPVAAAIDQPYVKASRRRTIRRPPNLPPALESQKQEIEEYEQAIAVVEKEKAAEARRAEGRFRLQFDPQVRAKVGEFLGYGMKTIFQTPEETKPVDELVPLAREGHGLHKSQWLSMMPPKGTERPYSGATSKIKGSKEGIHKTEGDQTSEDTSILQAQNRKSAETDQVGQDDGLKLKRTVRISVIEDARQSSSAGGEPMRLTSSRRSTRGSVMRSRQASTFQPPPPSPPELPHKTLSRSTVRFLKRLTREGTGTSHTVLTSMNVDALLRMTLTGTKWTIPDEQDSRATSSSSAPPRTPNRFTGGYNPGEFKRAMKAADDGKLPSSVREKDTTARGIDLVIPHVKEFKDEDDQSAVDDEDADETEDASDSPAKQVDIVSDLLSADFSIKFLQILGKSKNGASTNVQLGNLPRFETLTTSPADFSLARLVILLKRVATERSKPNHNLVGINETSTSTAGNDITDFLGTPYATLREPPEPGSPAYAALCKVLMVALCDDSDDHSLRFEAFKIYTAVENNPVLGRWEAIAFRKVLEEMLQDGNDGDRWLSATTMARQNEITPVVLSILLRSLGEVEISRRRKAIDLLANLGPQYAEQVLVGILATTASTSWKVRHDSVLLLERWIQKLAPEDYSSEAGTPQSGGSDPSRPSTTTATRVSTPSSRPSTHLTEEPDLRVALLQKSFQSLLTLMWNDWSSEVRDVAALTLGRLGKGNMVIEWIDNLLGSPDPLRRIDALRSLTRLGVLQPAAVTPYLNCLVDEFTSVRIEACKLACIIQMQDRDILNALLDRFNDFAWHVRAYAVKAVGNQGNVDPQVRAALRCVLYHDPHSSVRAEAIESAHKLGLLSHVKELQEAVYTLLETDASLPVRKEAERTLIAVGLIGPSLTLAEAAVLASSEPTSSSKDSLANTLSAPSQLPTSSSSSRPQIMIAYPHILANRPPSEVEVFLRTSLVAEKELEAVIDQVREMAGQSRVTAEVAEIPEAEEELDEDLERPDDHMPDIKSIHGHKARKRADAKMPEITRKLPGVPLIRHWQHVDVPVMQH